MKSGDNVTWLHTSKRGREITYTTKRGTVKGIEGETATVQNWANNQMVKLHVSRLRLEGQQTELTEALSAVFPSLRKKEGE